MQWGGRSEPSDVARQTGYSPRTVQNTLAEMARSGVVQTRSGNREKWYCLQSGILDHLLKPEGSPTPWVNWAPLFRALEMIRGVEYSVVFIRNIKGILSQLNQ